MNRDLAIDENTKNTSGGMVQGTRNVFPFFMDDFTKRLLIEIRAVTSFPPYVAPTQMEIDSNTKNTTGGVSSADGKTIIPLIVDEYAGVPFLRVEFI